MNSIIKKYPSLCSLALNFFFYWFFSFLCNSGFGNNLGKMYVLTFLLGKISCWIGKLFDSTCLSGSILATVQIGTIALVVLFIFTYFLIKWHLKKYLIPILEEYN